MNTKVERLLKAAKAEINKNLEDTTEEERTEFYNELSSWCEDKYFETASADLEIPLTEN